MDENIPTPQCLQRIKEDIKAFRTLKAEGISIHVDEKDKRIIHALIIGPKDTPYDGGFFYLLLTFPSNYPLVPPDVKLMTTGEGTVTFNPNFHSSGRVFLSIPGTFPGLSWSADETLSTLLLFIQSLMNEKPLYNALPEISEPESERYNQIIEHETLRVAVCDMLEGRTEVSRKLPGSLRDIMERKFMEFYDLYESIAQSRPFLNGQAWSDPMFGYNKGCFDYSSILERLRSNKKILLS